MIRIFLAVAAAVLLLGGATADAASYTFLSSNYSTSYQTPEAPGTNIANGGTTFGGICLPGGSGYACNALAGTAFGGSQDLEANTGNATSSGLIEFTLPGVGVDGLQGGQSWLVTISVQGNSGARTGDIYEATQCTGNCTASGSFAPLLTTNAVCLSPGAGQACTANASYNGAVSSGTVTETLAPASTYTIGITDLLEQYMNGTDNLPGLSSIPQHNAALDGGTVISAYSTDVLQFTVTITATPEPASLALLGGAVTLLGAARRRGRGLRAPIG